ncbi:dTDP-glucose 4,6-dehydratase [Lutibacter aestuarii]|uniref:dTDP-glucose 4,6-dehydratase n=1 Tax=Lutibacter aestuarii TaxID=861111 RepID=A0ABW2Z8G6_9FLAO
MKNTISILGCGWLGLPLAKLLLNNGFFIKGSTTSLKKTSYFKTLSIEPYLIDLENVRKLDTTFLNSGILIIAIPSKNIEGFKILVDFIRESSIKKVIFISSTSVYPSSNSMVNETSKLVDSPLVSIENLIKNNSIFSTTIVRFAGLFGYDRKPGNFFKNGRKISNPNGFVNMIHQDDCVQILLKIIEGNHWGITLNACADTHPTRKEFYTKTTLDIGNPLPLFVENKNDTYKIISNKKLKKTLNYTFKYADLMKLDYRKL